MVRSALIALVLLSPALCRPAQASHSVVTPKEGSVIIFENGALSRAIRRHTGSGMSHAAIVIYDKGKPYVYESTWPIARRMTWEAYKSYIASRQCKRRLQRMGLRIHLLQPTKAFTQDELVRMRKFANSQLGRRYRMRNWLQDRDSYGTHCSQFVAEVLRQSPRYPDPRYWKASPYDVYARVRSTHEMVSYF